MLTFAKSIGAVAVLLCSILDSPAASISESNKVLTLPLFTDAQTTCSATLYFKPVSGVNDQHAYVVVQAPDGNKLELRGGPSRGGGVSTWVPGRITSSSGEQPTGNPFACTTAHNWGVVVPYVGPHGIIGQGPAGTIHSPDGNTPNPTATVALGRGAQGNICKLANCMMTILKAQGSSCKIYTVGVGALRNSNTVISQALAACGVADPRPATITATGWGNGWE